MRRLPDQFVYVKALRGEPKGYPRQERRNDAYKGDGNRDEKRRNERQTPVQDNEFTHLIINRIAHSVFPKEKGLLLSFSLIMIKE